MKKVLIITYYWPPSGGAGVQRWVKLTKYLAKLDIEIFVITVDEKYASYMVLDESLQKDISENVNVFRTKSFEPINLYGKIVGKKNIPTAGFSNVDNSTVKQRIINFIRSNLFIPDPRRCWNRYAYKKACEVIEKFSITNVITTSPPHSSQLLGLKLKKKYNLNWIADLRDPWTDIYYYSLLNHSFLSKRIDRYYEMKILKNADSIFTVSESLRNLFLLKDSKINKHKFYVIPNGFDPQDFNDISVVNTYDEFTITYTGTMSSSYKPNVLFDALIQLTEQGLIKKFVVNIVGSISKDIKSYILNSRLSEYVNFIPNVPHAEIIGYQINSHLLLLVIPEVDNSEVILTGKIFEYLATGNKILCLGPKLGDASKIIELCHAGVTFERNELSEIMSFIAYIYQFNKSNKMSDKRHKNVELFNREIQAKKIFELIS
ncbi:MAG: glycosyltransferase [Saprospiraceae bacterium]|nr:glycosyltransferase [Saprospiraceae bacterium]